MLKVHTGSRSIKDYTGIIPHAEFEKILSLSNKLKGLKVLHINATAFGGGVAEILHTLVPLMNDVGLSADWKVIEGTQEFFELTKPTPFPFSEFSNFFKYPLSKNIINNSSAFDLNSLVNIFILKASLGSNFQL